MSKKALGHENLADIEVLERIQQRVLWLAVRMVDYANREREIPPRRADATANSM